MINLARLIVPSQMKHHAEAEACDLLMEVEQLDILQQYVDDAAYNRLVLYVTISSSLAGLQVTFEGFGSKMFVFNFVLFKYFQINMFYLYIKIY